MDSKTQSMKTEILTYDPERYDFRGVIASFIGREDLESLRAQYSEDPSVENSLYKNMEQSPIFQRMYSGLESAQGKAFYELYEHFIHEVIRPQYAEPIYYQTKPSHRILFADVPGQSRFHRDADYGHHPAEINYWVPQTPALATNTLWIETEKGKEDYQPIEARPGEYVRFRGSTLSHGARCNETGKSRVSFDFRIIAASLAPEQYQAGERARREGNPVMDNALNFSYCE